MTEVNFRDILPPRYPEDELCQRTVVQRLAVRCFPGRVSPLAMYTSWSQSLPEEITLTRSALITGARYKTVSGDGHVEDVYAYRRR